MVAKLSLSLMQEIAKKKRGKCLSTVYQNSKEKLQWKCKERHNWTARPTSIGRGSWCPQCFRKGKSRSIS